MLNRLGVCRKFSLPNSRQSVYANLLVGFSFLIFSFLSFTMLSPIVSSNAEKITAEDGAVYVASLSTDDLTQIAVIPTNEQTVFSGNNSIRYSNSCPYGFNVSMSSSTSNTSLTRTGDDSGSKTIKSVSTSGPLEDNSWGYSLDDGETYNPIPSPTSPVTLVNTIDEITTETTKNVKYGIKLNSDIPSGSYSSDIVYTVAVKPRCITYDLKWNLNGGTGASGVSYADKTINYGNTINLQTYKPTREGYTFEGWTTSAGYTFGPTIGEIDVNPSNANGVTLTAKWELENYDIEYMLNGGTVSPANPTSYNIETNTITLNNPTRTGYTFSGWSGTGLSGSANKSVTIPKGSTGTKLFVANWSANKYTVTYEDWFVDASNNRKVKLGSTTKSVNYGTSVSGTELGTDTSNSKYYLNYSYRSATSGTVPANNNLVVYRYFYAWTDLNIYYAGGSTQGGATVSLSTNGSNWTDVTNESDTIQPYGTTYYIKNIRPVHSYEEFDRVENLSYNSSAGYYTYTPTTAGTSMSIWMKYKTYSISYNLNGGSASNPTSYNYTSSFTLNNPTRGGYNFTGWSGTGLSGSANRSVTIPSGSTGNRSYTANWQASDISTISTMQAMTSTICSNMSSGSSKNLTDTRDNNVYTIKKLADGKCWMTQNLRLVNKTISSSDSNLPSGTYTVPASNLSNFTTAVNTSAAYIDSTYGGYYNFYTATAGWGTTSVSSGNSTKDICPKGWRLPTGGSSGEFKTLYNNYNSSALMQGTPGFVFSGIVTNGSVRYQGSRSYAWSASAAGDDGGQGAYNLLIKGTSSVYPADFDSRCYGLSVRCVAK